MLLLTQAQSVKPSIEGAPSPSSELTSTARKRKQLGLSTDAENSAIYYRNRNTTFRMECLYVREKRARRATG